VPPDVKAGDEILFGKWSGTEVKIDGEDLLIMKEDIMGVVEGAAKSKTTGSTSRKAGALAAGLALAALVTLPFAAF
jgi:hypothetical protein